GSAAAAAEVVRQLLTRDLAIAVGIHDTAADSRSTGEGVDGAAAEEALRRRNTGRLVLVEDAVLVRVVLVEHVVDELVPGGQIRLAIDPDVQPDQQRPAVGQEDEVLHIAGGLRLLRSGRGARDQHEREQTEWQTANGLLHASTSWIGLAPGSVMRIGRPTLDRFCLVGSMPRAVLIVASRSATATGRSSMVVPSALVLPTTCPPLMPPPDSTVDHELAQWSRPLLPLILGVRPNSPIQTTSVVSSKPFALRSSSRVAQPGSRTELSFCTELKLSWCVSQPNTCRFGTLLSVTS